MRRNCVGIRVPSAAGCGGVNVDCNARERLDRSGCWLREHRGRIKSSGVAPLGVTFRTGERPFATWYRSERVISDK